MNSFNAVNIFNVSQGAKKVILIFTALFGLWSGPALGGVNITVTSVKRIPLGGTGLTGIEVNYSLNSWDENDTQTHSYLSTNVEVGVGARICQKGGNCYFLLESPRWGDPQYPSLAKANTVGELGAALRKVIGFPYHGKIRLLSTVESYSCFTIGIRLSWMPSHVHEPLFDCSSSQIIPPIKHSCKFDSDTLELDHGTLTTDQVAGHKATGNLMVRCTNDVNFTVRIAPPTGKGEVKLINPKGEVIDAILSFTGRTGNTFPTTANMSGKSIGLTSTLSGMPVSASGGTYKGSGVVTLNLP
ncbi:hypothetical protein BFS14_15415 [Serratia fonticola]|uniref:MrpH family fimbial adhesin n=1 Tax=Serratia fonticola TaxID=47917 RepID=UPI0008FD3E2F|nr:hypothetical protein [Serratia fonticola]OIX95239.1 hypothetical protein BFS14_15415 [Serratia fonticola]QCR62971.1 hypothetical protein FD644_22620 [Serratia fonticola]